MKKHNISMASSIPIPQYSGKGLSKLYLHTGITPNNASESKLKQFAAQYDLEIINFTNDQLMKDYNLKTLIPVQEGYLQSNEQIVSELNSGRSLFLTNKSVKHKFVNKYKFSMIKQGLKPDLRFADYIFTDIDSLTDYLQDKPKHEEPAAIAH